MAATEKAPAVPSSASIDTHESKRVEEKIVNEEYKIWKKSCPFLYDMLIIRALEWPSLTIEWLPGVNKENARYSTAQLLLGTHTSGQETDHVLRADVDIPTGNYQEHSTVPNHLINISAQASHTGEVNIARSSYVSGNIATIGASGAISLFSSDFAPLKTLSYHTLEGWALSWSTQNANSLVSGSIDTTVALWDIEGTEPIAVGHDHTGIVTCVDWSTKIPQLYASVSDDLSLQIHDTRGNGGAVIRSDGVHDDGVNAVSFNPLNETLIATGGHDNLIQIWDLRRLDHSIHALSGHSDQVSALHWSPHNASVLGSAGHDRRVLLWDLSLEAEIQEDQPQSELLFMHGGHTNRVCDFSWHPELEWVLASASEDNIVQVWKPANDILYKQEEAEAEEE